MHNTYVYKIILDSSILNLQKILRRVAKYQYTYFIIRAYPSVDVFKEIYYVWNAIFSNNEIQKMVYMKHKNFKRFHSLFLKNIWTFSSGTVSHWKS